MILQDVCHVLPSVDIIPGAEEALFHAANQGDKSHVNVWTLHIYFMKLLQTIKVLSY